MTLYWSKSRYRRFLECRRSHFLHYVVAEDGWSEDAPPEARAVRDCKRLDSLDWYFHRILREVLHRSRPGDRAEHISDELWRRWNLDRAYGNAVFRELFYGEIAQAEFDRLGNERLKRLCRTFRKSELAQWLANRELPRLKIELPLFFTIGEVGIYTSPFALVGSRETFAFLELSGARMTELAALHQYYALHYLQLPPERVRSCFYDLETGEMFTPELAELNFTSAAGNASCEAAGMAAAYPPDVAAARAYLAVPGNRNHCRGCNFRKICEN